MLYLAENIVKERNCKHEHCINNNCHSSRLSSNTVSFKVLISYVTLLLLASCSNGCPTTTRSGDCPVGRHPHLPQSPLTTSAWGHSFATRSTIENGSAIPVSMHYRSFGSVSKAKGLILMTLNTHSLKGKIKQLRKVAITCV